MKAMTSDVILVELKKLYPANVDTTEEERAQWGSIRLHTVKDRGFRNDYVTLTEEEYQEWVAVDKPQYYEGAGTAYEFADLKKAVTKSKDTPLGLPAPEPPEDWTEPELTPPYGQPLNCYLCSAVTRMTRWDMPICARCDKLCRRDHANGRT